MNRRSFLSGIFGAAATLAIDPEKFLWTPTKTIFIPKPKIVPGFTLPPGFHIGEVISFSGSFARHPRTQAVLPFLRQFVVTSEDGSLYPLSTTIGMHATVSDEPHGEVHFFGPHSTVLDIN